MISIIIVNYNTIELLKRLLVSIKENVKPSNYEVIVVDNNSLDGSGDFIKNNFSEINLVENKSNIGFSRANNQGAEIAKGRDLLFLNSDTIIPEGVIEKMTEFSEKNRPAAVIGPKLLNIDETVQRSCGIFPTLVTEFSGRTFLNRLFPKHKIFGSYKLGSWDYASKRSIDWVSGACMMIRKEVFEQIGGFDENIYMFYEDVDLCFRVKQLGYEIFVLPEVAIYHLHGGSWRHYREIPIFHSCKSAVYFFRKHHKKWQTTVLKFLILLETFLSLIVLTPYLLLTGETFKGVKSRMLGYAACFKFVIYDSFRKKPIAKK